MEKIKMVTSDKAMVVRYWDENAEYQDINTYATVHEIGGAAMFIEPFAIMTDDNGKVYRHYYNREKMSADIEILEMSEF